MMQTIIDLTKYPFMYYSDASGNPVTQQVQSVAVTDASGNPVTGIVYKISIFWYIWNIQI